MHSANSIRTIGTPVTRVLLVVVGIACVTPLYADPPDAVIELWEQHWTLNADGSTVYHEKQHVRLNSDRAYGEFADPVADTFVTADLQFDPNSITMATNDQFVLVQCDGEFTLEFKYTGSAYQVQLALTTDGGTDATGWYTITDEYHHIRIVWKASSGAGNNDGYAKLFIDDVLQEQILGLDTDTLSTDEVQFGAISGLDAGTYGIIYMDNCQWNDALTTSSLAGPWVGTGTAAKKAARALAGPGVFTGAVAKKAKRALAGPITFAGALLGKAKKALAGAITFTGALAKYLKWIFFARFHDYFLNAPQRFTISSNKVQMTARYRDYYLTAPEKK